MAPSVVQPCFSHCSIGERLALRRGLDRVDQAVVGALRRVGDVGVGRDDVLLPVVEEELGRGPDPLDRPLGVLDVGQRDLDLVEADPGDLGLGDAERVDALADDLDRPIDVLGLDLRHLRRRAALVDELGAAAQVEPLDGPLVGDHPCRRREQRQHEDEDDQVAPAVGHRALAGLLGRQHQQQSAVVVIGGKQVGDGLRREVALGVDRDPLA